MSWPVPLAASAGPLGPALIGLLGVVVGAGINLGAQFVLAERRQKDERRTAVRLVDDELARALDLVEAWGGPLRRVLPEKASDIDMSSWAKAQDVLSLALDNDGWDVLREAEASVIRFRRSLEAGPDETDPSASKMIDDAARDALQKIRAARKQLEPYVRA